jgi:hypothetical protein
MNPLTKCPNCDKYTNPITTPTGGLRCEYADCAWKIHKVNA